jgi:hypothetical protein
LVAPSLTSVSSNRILLTHTGIFADFTKVAVKHKNKNQKIKNILNFGGVSLSEKIETKNLKAELG